MELEKQVVSLELAKKLKELGVKQNGLFYWAHVNHDGKEYDAIFKGYIRPGEPMEYIASAFTVAELGELCPYEIWNAVKNAANESVKAIIFNGVLFEADTEADMRAKMLIYLIENKLI